MRRTLRLFDVVCLGLNAIVGSGIFLLPDDLYREMGIYSPLAFLLCGLGLLPIALSYAALARRVDETGGPFVYASEAFGGAVGFLVGFVSYANAVFSFAAVSAAAGSHAVRLIPGADATSIAVATIVLFCALNFRGARPGALSIDIFTILKFSVLFVLVAVLLPEFDIKVDDPGLPKGPAGIGAAVFVALFALQGFEVVGVPAGETRNPQRAVPIAVTGSLLGAALFYVVIQLVLVGSAPDLGRDSDAPLVDAALAVAPHLGTFVAVGGLISILGFISGSAFGTPRYLFAMSSKGHFPQVLSHVHPRFGTPHVAIAFTAILAIGLVLAFDYRSLIGISNVSVAVQYFAVCASVLRMMRTSEGRNLRLGPVLPALGVLVSLWIFSQATRVEIVTASVALGLGWLARRQYLRRAR